MIPTSWVYFLKKEELTTYLVEFELNPNGTVEELRKQLAWFIVEHGNEHTARLSILAEKHARSISPRPIELPTDATKKDAKTSMEMPQNPTQSQVAKTLPETGYPTLVGSLPATFADLEKPSVCAYTANTQGRKSTEMPRPPATTQVTNREPWSANLTQLGTSPTPRESSNTEDETTGSRDCASLMDKVRKWSIKYAGGQGPLSFIERIEELSDVYGVECDHIPRIMSELLQGKALTWYRCNKKPWNTWATFKREFLEFFLPPRYFDHLDDNIRQRQQLPRESFNDYVVSLQELMHHTTFSEQQKLERLYRNSRQEFQLHIKRREFQTLNELLVLAGDYESIKAAGVNTGNQNFIRNPVERNRQMDTDETL